MLSGMGGNPERCVARSSSVISCPAGLRMVAAGNSSRTGSSNLIFPCTAICASTSPVKVFVIEPISKIEPAFAVPYVNTRRTPCFETPIATPPHVPGAKAPLLSAGARSRSNAACKPSAATGAIAGSVVRAGTVWAGTCVFRATGQTRPVTACRINTVRPREAATPATFARNMARARTGKGANTKTSRRSGNVESQLSTANRPTTSIVVAIRKCSPLQACSSRA